MYKYEQKVCICKAYITIYSLLSLFFIIKYNGKVRLRISTLPNVSQEVLDTRSIYARPKMVSV